MGEREGKTNQPSSPGQSTRPSSPSCDHAAPSTDPPAPAAACPPTASRYSPASGWRLRGRSGSAGLARCIVRLLAASGGRFGGALRWVLFWFVMGKRGVERRGTEEKAIEGLGAQLRSLVGGGKSRWCEMEE